MKCFLAILCTLFLATFAAHAATPGNGAPAPNFTLQTPEGQPISLAKLNAEGPVVLVLLRGYPGYQCPYCIKQVHDFIQNAPDLQNAGLQILFVYPGAAADLTAHAKDFLAQQTRLPFNVHLVLDPDYQMTNLYGLRWDAPHETAYPATFLINKKGIITFSKISTGHGDRTTAGQILLLTR